MALTDQYNEALDYLYGLPKYGKSPDLSQIKELLSLLDNPQTHYPSIVIGGTNGKGSVANICFSILQAAGYKTGLFTSPHLREFWERFRVGAQWLSPSEIVTFTHQIRSAITQIQGNCPSGFEAFSALAHLAFAHHQVDGAVLEVGLGGRLDPTTISNAQAGVITQVGMEHTELLGSTKAEIAREKLGILRPGMALFSAETDPEIQDLMEKKCLELESPFFLVGRHIFPHSLSSSLDGQWLEIQTPYGLYDDLYCPLLGDFQLNNIAVAVGIVDYLREQKIFSVDHQAIKKGLASVVWPARLEKLRDNPVILLDCAHNLPGIQALTATVRTLLKEQEILLLAGFSDNKPYPDMMRELANLSQEVIFSQASYRATPAKTLAELAEREGLFQKIWAMDSIPKALDFARQKLSSPRALLITGGLFFAGDVREVFKHWPEPFMLP